MLFLPRLAIGRGSGAVVHFGVHVRKVNREGVPPLVRLTAVCGAGDRGELVISMILPGAS